MSGKINIYMRKLDFLGSTHFKFFRQVRGNSVNNYDYLELIIFLEAAIMTARPRRPKPNYATACLYLFMVSVVQISHVVRNLVVVHGCVQSYHCKYVVQY